jgi:hypothetical protein
MNSRVLATVAITAILELFTIQAFAQKSKKAKSERSVDRIYADWCGPYYKASHTVGFFNRSEIADQLERNGLSFGMGCYYDARGKFTFGVGAELYFGNLDLAHKEEDFSGSFSYFEEGFNEWVKVGLNSDQVRIDLSASVQITTGNRFKVNSLKVNLWDTWYDFTKFGLQHMASKGELEVWGTALDFGFLVSDKFSIALGAKWQRYRVKADMDFDNEAKNFFGVLYFDIDSLKKNFNESVDFFYLTPGVKWCGENICASFVVPYGAFTSRAWSWGSELQMEIKF